jgi:hypothetical protein
MHARLAYVPPTFLIDSDFSSTVDPFDPKIRPANYFNLNLIDVCATPFFQGPPDYPPTTWTENSNPPGPPRPPTNNGSGGEWRNRALLLGAFFLGIGAGVWFSEDVNLYPNNVASTELVDRRTPNSEICMSNGYSAMVFDQRIFVSFNPCALASFQMLILLCMPFQFAQPHARLRSA